MMRQASPAFVQWAGSALSRWQGPERLTAPVFHIHGSADRIIPCRKVKPDVIVPGAGHLVNVTHAEPVNTFLAERMKAVLRSPSS
jgi:pimeloyl-ACP methyl ester carboxylesterase